MDTTKGGTFKPTWLPNQDAPVYYMADYGHLPRRSGYEVKLAKRMKGTKNDKDRLARRQKKDNQKVTHDYRLKPKPTDRA